MPRKPQGLRPIGESVKKIIEKIKKEREERQGRDKPIRTQPKLPGMKKGGLTGGQKKLDANKDGQISGEDFKILKAKKNKMKGGGIAIRGTNFKGVY